MNTFITILVSVLLALFLLQVVSLAVCGWFEREKTLDEAFNSGISEYRLNSYNNNILTTGIDSTSPVVAIVPFSFFSPLTKWALLLDGGSIPRWSKWSRALDIRRRELLNEKKNGN